MAGVKSNSSHTWRAILHGREALKLGIIKRVGNGSSIRVWDDPWVEANRNYKPMVRKDSATATMVDELIDHTTGEWDMGKLEANFVLPDVHSICRITIG